MDAITAGLIVQAVANNLDGADLIAMVPATTHNIMRSDYWERAWIVTWRRELRNGQPDKTGDGMTYATHRVHVNSKGDAACFDGHYDQERNAALADMCDRANLVIPATATSDPENDSALALWFTPDAIRQHFDGDEDELAEWVENASDDDLILVGAACLEGDSLYKEFRYLLTTEVQWQIDHPNGTEEEA